MHKKVAVLLAVFIAVITAISLFATVSFLVTASLPTRNLSRSVIRNFNTDKEESALTAAETADYLAIATSSAIEISKRFEGSSDTETYIQPELYRSYMWANFIDLEIINYYQNRYDYQQKQIFRPRNVTFTYNANVTHLEQLHIFNTIQQEQGTTYSVGSNGLIQNEPVTWNITVITFYDPDKSIPLLTVRPFEHILYRNQSEYQTLSKNFDLNFSNCYLVEMNLEYSQISGPVTAFTSIVQQIVVLDQNLVPI